MITPAGNNTTSSWAAVCDGTTRAAPDARLASSPVTLSCAVPDFDPVALLGSGARRMDRFTQFAVAAAQEAVEDSRHLPGFGVNLRAGVVMGTAFGGVGTWEEQAQRLAARGSRAVHPLTVPMGIGNSAASAIAARFGLHGPVFAVTTACAAGTTALGAAADALRWGQCDVALAGGADAAVTPVVASAFDKIGALSRRLDHPGSASRPFDRQRDGFVLGEGAAVLVLERESDARARGAVPYARVLGHASTCDAYHLTSPEPSGRFAALAVREALDRAGVTAGEVGYVNAHATGTPEGDAVEARVISEVFGASVMVSSTKGVTGHMMGAAGAVEAAFSALAVHHGIVPPTANLDEPDPAAAPLNLVREKAQHVGVELAVSNSFGFGGHNSTVLLGKP
ncbi:beta-ketoacyl-[acyl-carrier-protein] synthase family protein [Lentzea flaviverrucosa]|nr:beta-ketoacyl-[acyl-carrier-protein] synthase family protein [Lentzea flaviverrucosa]